MTEKQKEYSKYLKSDGWKTRRKQLINNWGNKCAFCGKTEKVNLHHLSYENLGKETIRDVVPLCKGCHLDIHRNRLKIWIFTSEEYEAYKKIKHIIADKTFDIATFIIDK